MKDAQAEYLRRLNDYRDQLERIAKDAEVRYDFVPAVSAIEAAVRITHQVVSLESLMELAGPDDMVVPASDPEDDTNLS